MYIIPYSNSRNSIMCKEILAQHISKILKETKSFEKCLKHLKFLSLGDGKCKAELKVSEENTNLMGTLHGGLSATLLDCVSTYGLHSHKNASGVRSVSVNINVSYIGSAKVGDHVVIESDTLKFGKNLAFCEIVIKNRENGKILVKGEHTKFLLD
ncbi:acyl-coenzyme A thioesterase 13-like [Diorhabda carinulata]|uniref:acyl-coenzyme A thioesterase 13-like n=1 Tax=Diorhabda carinulata TaxID=1163345 RepID=UPI0025A1D870|nr:acyl-coenzyme A thioesterase 13-like [Diorhabda carinulata]